MYNYNILIVSIIDLINECLTIKFTYYLKDLIQLIILNKNLLFEATQYLIGYSMITLSILITQRHIFMQL